MADISESFRKWVAANGAFMNPRISFFHDLGSDRGVVARKKIKANTQLVSVPLHMCVHLPTDAGWASHQAGALDLDEATIFLMGLPEPLSPFLGTTLLLMHHVAKGKESRHAPYLATMPAQHDCTLLWGGDDMAELAGTSIEGCGKASVKREFQGKARPIMQQRRDLWPAKACGFKAFLYAAGMVQSRAFHVQQENWITGEASEGKELYLIPGIDMLNHSTLPERRNTALQYSPPGASEAASPGAFCMTAGRAVQAGEQVLHTYGDLSDAALLQTYGFVEDLGGVGNPHNCVRLPATRLTEACAALAPDAPIDSSACEHTEGHVYQLTAGDPLPNELLEEAHELSKQASLELAPLLLKVVDAALASYKGSQKEDASALADGRCSERQRKALLVRMGERRILMQTKLALVEMLVKGNGGGSSQAGSSDEDSEDDAAEEEEEEEEEEAGEDGEESDKESAPRILSPDGGEKASAEAEEEASSDLSESEQEDAAEEDDDEQQMGSSFLVLPKPNAISSGSAAAQDGGGTAQLLSSSVLPQSGGRAGGRRRRSSALLGMGDPVRKRLKF